MTTAIQNGMIWLNQTFGAAIDSAIKNTPFSKALVVSIAIQETFYVWAKIYNSKTPDDVLQACVGDSIDGPSRKAFPVDRAQLEAWPKGKDMFALARAELERLAKTNSGYKTAAKNKNKFCRGYGLFQYDLQFFKVDPDYFLNEEWKTFAGTLGKCISELKAKAIKLGYDKKTTLIHDESVYLAIAYNKGSAKTNISDPAKKFKQGHYDKKSKKFYGQYIDENLKATQGLW